MSVITDEGVFSRMVTTIDDDMNGFRHLLIKMALSGSSLASEAVLQGILAISAYHLFGSGAGLLYSFAATEALSRSMQVSTGFHDRISQLAAIMLLASYEVCLYVSFALFVS